MADAYVKVASVASVPAGQTILVTVGNRPVLLANVDGEFYAVSGICSRKKLPLQGARLDGCRLICPWHFTEFDVRTGEQVKWAYGGPLATFPVKRKGDILLLQSSLP